MQAQTQLVNLPPELLIHVLAQLDLPALAACHQVCHHLHNTLLTSTLLQYRTLLQLHGLSSSSPLPTHTLLSHLQAHTSRWHHLLPSSTHTLPLPPNTGSTYDLYGSLFVRGLAISFPRGKGTDALHVIQLPSAVDERPGREWIWRAPGRQGWSDFTLSPSEDLVALVQKRPAAQQSPNFQIHLLTLSSALPHPSARSPVLQHACRDARPPSNPGRATACSYHLQICGSSIACLFLPREQTAEYVREEVGEELVIWDWRTGAVRAVYVGSGEEVGEGRQERSGWADPPKTFSFLDEDTILVAGTDTGDLEICTIPLSSNSSTNSSTSTSPGQGSTPTPPQLIKRVRLLLPALRPSNATVLSILTRSDPSPGEGPFGLCKMPREARPVSTTTSASASTSASPSPGGVSSAGSPKGAEGTEGTEEKVVEGSSELFYPSPSARLLTISLTLDSPPNTVSDLTIFVLFSTLLAALHSPDQFFPPRTLAARRSPNPLQAHYDESHDDESILVLPWPAWSGHARASTKPHEPQGYVCYTHGYRYITSSLFIPAHLHAQAQQAGLAGLVAADALEGMLCTKVEVWDFNPAMVRRVKWEQERERGRAGLRQLALTGAAAPSPSPPHGDDVEAGREGQWADLAQLVEEEAEQWLDTDEDGSEEEEEDEDEDAGVGEDADWFQDMGEDGGGGSPEEVDHPAAAPHGVPAVPDPATPRVPAVEQLLLAPATIPAQDVFVDPVHSGLAAVVRSLEVPGPLSGLFIDGERVIMLIQRGGRELLKVDVF
ncbi:hypothetical protein CALVIDRAFT_569784 [Calocera viscosa TUFC12733]|uniref:F-box domain-containing protein n=1 Tax=Calocera viscosa (strain TUFC12733) TaxID=1330018 RepID=A0A167FL10_CALVF|nr:hypothetical protein CALVIDRAFT_569784 [Calocera viscosa TUFC12733]